MQARRHVGDSFWLGEEDKHAKHKVSIITRGVGPDKAMHKQNVAFTESIISESLVEGAESNLESIKFCNSGEVLSVTSSISKLYF